jgi:hypothetical protein
LLEWEGGRYTLISIKLVTRKAKKNDKGAGRREVHGKYLEINDFKKNIHIYIYLPT